MSYDVSLFRHETRLREASYTGEDFFAEDENLLPFTPAQHQRLHERLLATGFTAVGSPRAGAQRYELPDPPAEALLTGSGLYLSASYSQEGIFEIGMLASELTDTGEFAKYDSQAGGWEDVA